MGLLRSIWDRYVGIGVAQNLMKEQKNGKIRKKMDALQEKKNSL